MEESGITCPYYKRDESMGNRFYCTSPRNENPQRRFCSDGADRGLFVSNCSNPCGGMKGHVCRRYVKPVQAPGPLTKRQSDISRPDNDRDGKAVPQAKERAAGGRYSFGREKNMCVYWRKDENLERRYHCASPGNPQGESHVFCTAGGTPEVERFRSQCRRADEEGTPPSCPFFPGGGNKGELEEDPSGELVKKAAKAVGKAAIGSVIPGGGIVADAAANLVDELL